MDDWFLAQVKPNADRIAKRNLERQGFVTFQPNEWHTVVWAGPFQQLLRPFIAGYMFLRYSGSATPWFRVNSTYGVARLVRIGDRPATVPVAVFDELKAACDRDDIVQLKPRFCKGADVEVSCYCFRNLVGKVERLSPGERAVLLLDFIRKQAKVTLPSSHRRVARSLRG